MPLCHFGLKTGLDFAHVGLKSGMVFERASESVRIYLPFQFESGGKRNIQIQNGF